MGHPRFRYGKEEHWVEGWATRHRGPPLQKTQGWGTLVSVMEKNNGSKAGPPALHHKRNRRVVVSASVGIFQRLVQVGSTLVLMPLLLRVLGPATSLAWLSGLVDIGTGTALVTLVARSSALEGAEQALRHITGALSIGSGLAGLMLLAACVASLNGRAQGGAGPYFIAAIGLALNLPLNCGNNVWMALQKGYVSGFWELVQTLVTTTGLIVATLLTRD